MKKRIDPRKLGARCGNCPLALAGNPVQPVLGEGPKDAVGVLLGESPGRDEAEIGRPFVGATGQALNEALLSVNLQRSKLFVANAVCCRPPPSRTEHVMRKAVACCRPVLIRQLAALNSCSNILTMGKWAYFALMGRTKGLKNARGFLRDHSLETTLEAHRASKSTPAKRAKKKSRRNS
jgi:uracil-DNA glycosylase family 4